MSSPNPFETASRISQGFSKSFKEQKDLGNIQEIINQSKQQGYTPDVRQNLIDQIITRVSPERQQMAMQALQARDQNLQQQKQQQAYQAMGYPAEFSSLPPNVQSQFIKSQVQGQAMQNQAQAKLQEKQAPLVNAYQTIQRMKELVGTGHTGPKFALTGTARSPTSYSGKGIQNRAEFERLGKSLIPFSTVIPPKNKATFMAYAEGLTDASLKKEQIMGNVLGMERMIKQSLGIYDDDSQGQAEQPGQADAQPLSEIFK